MRREIFKFALIFLVFLGYDLEAQNRPTSYVIDKDGMGGVDVVLYGRIVLKRFNAEPSLATDWRPYEDHYVIQLDEPITFRGGSTTETLNIMQLIIDSNMSRNFNPNEYYIVVGRAWFWQTAHHHTPVMIDVNRIVVEK